MICERCGSDINEGAVFCRYCGHNMSKRSDENVIPRIPDKTENTSSVIKPQKERNSFKHKKTLIVTICIAVILGVGGLSAYRFFTNPVNKIIMAYKRTINADCFRAKISSSYTSDLLFESYQKGGDYYFQKSFHENNKIALSYVDRAVLKYGNPSDFIVHQYEDDEYLDMADAISRRDFISAIKESSSASKGVEKYCEEYEQILPTVRKMFKDYFRDPDNCDFVERCRAHKNKITFEIDFDRMIYDAIDDYDLDIDEKIFNRLFFNTKENPDIDLELTISFENHYLRTVEMEFDNESKRRIDIEISNVNNIKPRHNLAREQAEAFITAMKAYRLSEQFGVDVCSFDTDEGISKHSEPESVQQFYNALKDIDGVFKVGSIPDKNVSFYNDKLFWRVMTEDYDEWKELCDKLEEYLEED